VIINKEGVKYVLRNLRNRKTRTFLTSLSILIGIITIFIFVSFGLGLYGYIEEMSQGTSMDKIIIQTKGGGAIPIGDNFYLTDSEIKAIERVPGVYSATGLYFKVAEIVRGSERVYTFLIAYDPENPLIMDVFNIGMEKGRMLQKQDNKKVVLGYSYLLEEKVLSKSYTLNQKINVQGEDLTIVGFFEEVGSPTDDAQIYIASDYFEELYPETKGYGWIIGRVDAANLDDIVEKVEEVLRKERDQKKGEEDFFVQSFDDMMESYMGALDIVIGFIILIALVSVVVSAINTSNTMITSVLERYKEIGVMKSIGAKNSEILGIFLFESALIGAVAGIVGVLIGSGISYLIGEVLASLGWSFLKPLFSVWLFVGCVAFATITGAISGVAPAIRASKINPVDALRYE
jgi:putative ABC transport system permease protein